MFHPTTFGKYYLTRRLAVGGMAEVFAAKLYGADGFEKDLVIKQILPQYAKDPEFVQSFVGEAKIAVTLNHANVVGIYELGRVDGTYFIAMEYVDGLDLYTLIDAAKRHGLQLGTALAILAVEEVAKGLDYAHRRLGSDGLPLGLVHRDLNPRNVLVSKEGEVKILDFGIAKTASRVAAMPKTRAGVVKGTTGYMSPEQATGREIDARTDIYQAGLLLFEALTGEALFWRPDDETTRELMRRHRVIPPSELALDVPPEIDELVLTLLQRDPGRRIGTAAELAARLARIRYGRYPDTTHAELGALVAHLVRLENEVSHPEPMPELHGEDLQDAISKAIEQTITGHIETIARAPSVVMAARAPKPITGSQPIEILDAPTPTPSPMLTPGDAAALAARAALSLSTPAPGPQRTANPLASAQLLLAPEADLGSAEEETTPTQTMARAPLREPLEPLEPPPGREPPRRRLRWLRWLGFTLGGSR